MPAEEEALIVQLLKSGLSFQLVAKRVNRSPTAVINAAARNNVPVIRRRKEAASDLIRPPGAITEAEKAAFRKFLGASA